MCNASRCSGSTGKGRIFLPTSPPFAGFRRCEGGSEERKIDTVQSAQVLHFASEFRDLAMWRIVLSPSNAIISKAAAARDGPLSQGLDDFLRVTGHVD